MRLSELAKTKGVSGKDLLKAVQSQGFSVKSDLAAVGEDVVAWIESQTAEQLAEAIHRQPVKKKSVPPPPPPRSGGAVAKKKPLRPKPGEEEAAVAVPAPEPAPSPAVVVAAPAEVAPAAKAPEKVEVKPEAPARPAPNPANAAAAAAAAARLAAVKQQQQPAKPKAVPLPPPPPRMAPPTIKGEVIIEEGVAAEVKTTGQKHKRADFKVMPKQRELPAIFADIDDGYAIRSLAGGGARRKMSPRGVGRMASSRRRKGNYAARMERDPNEPAVVAEGMTIRELSNAMGLKLTDILGFLMRAGRMAQVNDTMSREEVESLATAHTVPIEWEQEEDLEAELQDLVEARVQARETSALALRPPVVTFMGHVDHGKTSLLDRIRQTRVAAGEHGGITQHIGAYSAEKNGQRITFLDTPGHQAFTEMRARGAQMTDIVVLVVAADDGVMPQTEEAYNHAKNAGVPVVVAINKCDLPGANPDRARQELANRLGLMPEEWGGKAGLVEVSAHTGQGIDALLERILLEAEVLELKADADRLAEGHVLEARVTEGQGVVATMLVRQGTLRRGDVVLFSTGYGRVKLMYDEHGKAVNAAGPGSPVRVTGLTGVPEAGDRIYAVTDFAKARELSEDRAKKARTAALAKRTHVTLENLTTHLAGEGVKDLRLIIKADVMGSLEVLRKTVQDLSTPEVRIDVLHSAVGGINQADVILADASDALIVGFHVVADQSARLQAASHGVQIRIYHIIYRLIEDLKASLEGMLPPEEREVVLGHALIQQVFRASRIGSIAGCRVTDGVIQRNAKVRLIRDSVIIYEGDLASLRRVKDDAREVKQGFECGIKIANYDDIHEGDTIESFTVQEVARKLT